MNGCSVLGWGYGDGRKKERSQIKCIGLPFEVIKFSENHSEADGSDGCTYL